MSDLPSRQATDLKSAWRRDRPTLDYLIPGLIGTGEMCLLAGAPESGKTMLLAAIAASVTTGDEILEGFKPVASARVLYIDEEIGEYEFVRRLRKLVVGMGLDPETLFRHLELYAQQGHPLSTDERIREFHQSVIDFNPQLIVIDTFVSVYGADENDNSKVRRWFDRIVSPLRQAKRSVVISHHLNKVYKDEKRSRLARIRGATDFQSYPDKVWFAERISERSPDAEGQNLRMLLHTLKARRGDKAKAIPIAFHDSEDLRRMFVSGGELTPEMVGKIGKGAACKVAIRRHLRSVDNSCSRKVLREKIPAQLRCDTKTLNRAISDLEKEGVIEVRPGRNGLVTLSEGSADSSR